MNDLRKAPIYSQLHPSNKNIFPRGRNLRQTEIYTRRRTKKRYLLTSIYFPLAGEEIFARKKEKRRKGERRKGKHHQMLPRRRVQLPLRCKKKREKTEKWRRETTVAKSSGLPKKGPNGGPAGRPTRTCCLSPNQNPDEANQQRI